MLGKRLAPIVALAAIVVPTAAAEPIDSSTPTSVDPCAYRFTIGDYKRMAIPHWKRPNAPTQRYKHRKRFFLSCPSLNLSPSKVNHLETVYVQRYRNERLLRRYRDHCNSGDVISCIRYASIVEHYSFSTLYAIASCESGLNPSAYNPSGAGGLFQFMAGTFAATPYGSHDRYDPKWASLAAAWKMRTQGTSEWACA